MWISENYNGEKRNKYVQTVVEYEKTAERLPTRT